MGNNSSSSKLLDADLSEEVSVYKIFKRFTKELTADERYYLYVGTGALLVNAITNITYPKIIGSMMDTSNIALNRLDTLNSSSSPMSNASMDSDVTSITEGLFIKLLQTSLPLYISGSVASWARVSHLNNAVYLIQKRCRKRMFSKILKQGVPFFHLNTTNYLMMRLLNDCEEGPKFVIDSYAQFLRSCNSAIGGTIRLLTISPKLTLITLFSIPLVGLAIRSISSFIKKANRIKKEKIDNAIGRGEEAINNICDVVNSGQEDYEIEAFSKYLDECDSITYNLNNYDGLLMSSMLAGFNISSIIMLYFGTKDIASRKMSFGDLSSFVLYGAMIGLGIGGFVKVYVGITKAALSMDRVYKLHDLPELEDEYTTLPEVKGSIELKNVEFRYETRPDILVLDNINVKVESGDVVGIVGQSGVGKSTLCNIITTLYRPTAGAVYLDGVDVHELNSKWVRKNVFAVVSQEPTLFSVSIEDNIRYGNENISFEDICEMSKKCNIHDFIESLPMKYKTPVGASGVLLSVGQKQRIALVRALLKNTPFLILDEPTSSLDGFSEELINTAINLTTNGRTLVIVTHSPITLSKLKKIVVLNKTVEYYGSYENVKNHSSTFKLIFPTI